MLLKEELSGKKAAEAATTNDVAVVTNPDLYRITCHGVIIITIKMIIAYNLTTRSGSEVQSNYANYIWI